MTYQKFSGASLFEDGGTPFCFGYVNEAGNKFCHACLISTTEETCWMCGGPVVNARPNIWHVSETQRAWLGADGSHLNSHLAPAPSEEESYGPD